MTVNFRWISDAHLDNLGAKDYQDFIAQVKSKCSSHDTVLLITGDTTTGRRIEADHCQLAGACAGKMLYVLGNHDRWNSSFADVNKRIKSSSVHSPNASFMDLVDHVEVEPETFIVGDSGWYDGRNGLQGQPRFIMNDWFFIQEYIGKEPFKASAQLADACAARLEAKMRDAIAKGAMRLIVLTHVPPFVEACRHLGNPSDMYSLPWFSSQCIGDVLDQISEEFFHVQIEVLCGHTHSHATYKRHDNLHVSVKDAEYGSPEISSWKPELW
jgi:predicted phosphohydrolase